MLLFHLTLILKKATSERSHASLLEWDEVAAPHPSALSAALASHVCVCVCVCTCELSAPNLSALKAHMERKAVWITLSSRTQIHKVHSGSALERSAARSCVKSCDAPRGEDCLMHHVRICGQNTRGFRGIIAHARSEAGLHFLLASLQTACSVQDLTSSPCVMLAVAAIESFSPNRRRPDINREIILIIFNSSSPSL